MTCIKISQNEIEILIDGYTFRLSKAKDKKTMEYYSKRIEELTSYLEKPDKLVIYTDGSCKNSHDLSLEPNGSWGYVIQDKKRKVIHEECGHLGNEIQINDSAVLVSNNVAEYMAAVQALAWIVQNGYEHAEITLYTDSLLMVRQINRTSRTTAPYLLALRSDIDNLMKKIYKVRFTYVPRSNNCAAHDVAEKAYKEGVK